jgi:hypothetical protein
VIPTKLAHHNLLIGTWNVRDFDRMTQKWRSVEGGSPIHEGESGVPGERLTVLSIAPIIASALKAVFEDESVSGIFHGQNQP